MLACGVYETDITPSLGSSMPGYFMDRKSTGILDRLYAKALVIEAENQSPVAFVVLDTIIVPREVVEAIRERVSAHTDIPGKNIMISATHTHTGPPVSTFTFMKADNDYLNWLTKQSADAVILAYRNRQKAQIGVGMGHEANIAFQRRFFMKDGSVRTNPGLHNPDVVQPAGPIDPEVYVVRIDDAKGQPMGVLTNYACHTDTVGGTLYCADYPGELSAQLKKTLGSHVVSLFMQGACGNINHIDVLNGNPSDYAKPSDHYKKMGRILAGEVLKVREKISTSAEEILIQEVHTKITLHYRQPGAEDIKAAKKALQELPKDHTEYSFALELLEAAELGEGSTEAEIQVIRLGELAFVGLPGEIFVELGLEIKQQSPFKHTIVNELCNGIPGTYICTREAYEQGGYEPRITSNNRLQEETGDLFVQHGLQLLSTLKS